MTWSYLNKNTQKTTLGAEATFGTIATTNLEVFLSDPADPLGKSSRKMLENNDTRRYRRDYVNPVAGLQNESPVELSVYLKGLVARLDKDATPVAFNNASALSHQLVHRAMWGAELTPAAGSLVVSSSGTPVDAITVTTGQGSRFVEGQVIIVETSVGWEVRRVKDVTGDVVTVIPPCAGTPVDTTGKVLNAYNYYLDETMDTQSFSVQHTYVESAGVSTQRKALGCTFSGSMDLKVGEVPVVKLTGKSATHTNPADLSITTADATDDMGSCLVWEPAGFFTSTLTAAPGAPDITEVTFNLNREWQDVPGVGVEGLQKRIESTSRGKPVEVTLKGVTGTGLFTAFDANTTYSLCLYVESGTGANARFAGVYFPSLVMVEEPVFEPIGELVGWSAKFRANKAVDIDAAPSSASSTALMLTNAIFFNG